MAKSQNPSETELKEMFIRLGKEQEEIINAVGSVTHAWSNLESVMLHVFGLLTHENSLSEAASVVFYTPSNFETRISFLRNLFAYFFPSEASSTNKLLSECWLKIEGKIAGKQGVRNRIIHGTISSATPGLKSPLDQQMRLTPQVFDVARMRKEFNDKQKIGLSGSDIRAHVGAVVRLITLVSRLAGILHDLISKDPKAQSEGAAKLSELHSQLYSGSKNQDQAQ